MKQYKSLLIGHFFHFDSMLYYKYDFENVHIDVIKEVQNNINSPLSRLVGREFKSIIMIGASYELFKEKT